MIRTLSSLFPVALRAIRVHQLVKNLLVFLPAAMAHRLFDPLVAGSTLVAAIAFCFASSFVYIMNDLKDREADRQHRTKRLRPIASGELSHAEALLLAAVVAVASALLALSLPPTFRLVLLFYVVVSSCYSLFLKRLIVADIVVLASLYALRVLAGAVAAEVHVSQWLLLFSIFFFFSLACMKRFSELKVLKLSNGSEAAGRGYRTDDLELISQCGSASGYLSVLVMALYVSSKEVTALYALPQLIYLLCPLLLFWVTRVWLLAHRGEMHDDPIVFALRDWASYAVGAAGCFVLVLAV